jgi:hypothetical protein
LCRLIGTAYMWPKRSSSFHVIHPQSLHSRHEKFDPRVIVVDDFCMR